MSRRSYLPRTTGETGERICRYTLDERVHHWMGALFYIYCLVTGLAFWSPYMFWLAVVVGGGATARFWHPWLGLVFTVSMFWMYKMWRGDMRHHRRGPAWKKAMKYYIENEDEKLPPIGRFNYGQKLFFWLMFYGVILLLVSGVGLWFVEIIPWSLRWLRYLAVAVHVAAALAPSAASSFTSIWAPPWCAAGSLPSFAEKFRRPGRRPIIGSGMKKSLEGEKLPSVHRASVSIPFWKRSSFGCYRDSRPQGVHLINCFCRSIC